VKQTLVLLALVFLVACGGSPTTPTPAVTTTPPQAATPTPSADPAPTTPAPPVPTPPAPTPAPTPTPPSPSPSPAPERTVLHATVSSSHWYPSASFTLPDRFDVVIEGNRARIATLDPLPFSFFQSAGNFLVKQRDFEFVVDGGLFSFNGVNGQATGTISIAK
jgi:hypothetical protein